MPDPERDATERAAEACPPGAEQDLSAAVAEDAAFSGVVEDGVALHLVEPHDPGTIFVAVAEPANDGGDPAASAEGGAGLPAAGEAPGKKQCQGKEDFSADTAIPSYGDLVDVAAVRLNGLGPALYFTAKTVSCAPGDTVVVAMEEGLAYGVVSSVMRVAPAHLGEFAGEQGKICPVARKATDKDIAAAANNAALAEEALEYCRACIRERGLDMKLVGVLILHDRGKMIFYFTAPARIDFRELVKDLVRRYRTRIELRQIGVRHETQMVGALGNCGMVCCCRRYLRKFAPVAIKMAKEQNVFLNPVKISGICGRLLCCLAYEQEHYDEFYRSCPKLGKKYQTDAGLVRVLRASLFRESVSVLSEAGEEVEYPLAEWNALHPFRPNAPQQQPHPRKQEQQGGGRKGGERNGHPGQEPRGTRPHAKDTPPVAQAADRRPAGEAMPPQSLVIAEEQTVIVEEEGGVVVAQSRSVTALVQEEALPVVGDQDETDPDLDDGGSIFGLSPRRDNRPAGGNPDPGGQRASGPRPKRPRRRKRPAS